MWPFEFVATPIASPRYNPGGNFRKFGTDSKGISGTFCAFAFCARAAGIAPNKTSAKQMHDLHSMECIIYANGFSARKTSELFRFRPELAHGSAIECSRGQS